MESWRKVWREGVAPLLSDNALTALRRGLATDDARLSQGETVFPWHDAARDWPPERACLLGYCGWQGEGLKTTAEVCEFFACMCMEIDARLGEPAGCRAVLNAWDENPREVMLPLLLAEVDREIDRRRQAQESVA